MGWPLPEIRVRRAGSAFSVALLALVALLLEPSCQRPTEITLIVSTDVKCSDLQGTSITVGKPGDLEQKPATAAATICDPATGSVGSLVIIPSGDRTAEIALRVVAGIGKSAEECATDNYLGGCIVARRALHFIPGAPLVLPVVMRANCTNIPCDATRTCVNGACVSATVPDPATCTGAGCDETVLARSETSDAGGATDAVAASDAPDAVAVDAAIDTGMPVDAGDVCAVDGECASNQRCVVTSQAMPGVRRCRTSCTRNQDCPEYCVALVDVTNKEVPVCSGQWGPHHFGETITNPALDCDTNFVHLLNGTLYQCSRICVTNADCAPPFPTCKVVAPGFLTCNY